MMKEFLDQFPYVLFIVEAIYFAAVILLAAKIIMDTKTTSKTLAYLLLIIFIPVAGIVIYFVFGVNYRKNKFYNFKFEINEEFYKDIQNYIETTHEESLNTSGDQLKEYITTINFLYNVAYSPMSSKNEVEILVNGEEKFAKVFECIRNAKHHIHLEYYIYENDTIGNQLADLLILKAKEGLTIRFCMMRWEAGRLERK